MQVFNTRNWGSMVSLVVSVLLTAFVLLVLPAMVVTALWNAVVWGWLHGPEVSIGQGLLLWGIVLLGLQLLFKFEWTVSVEEADEADRIMEAMERSREDAAKPALNKEEMPEHWKRWHRQLKDEG